MHSAASHRVRIHDAELRYLRTGSGATVVLIHTLRTQLEYFAHHDARNLPSDLVDELWTCGSLPGHPHAFLSLSRQWRTWIIARAAYGKVATPATLVYSDHDWSWRKEREANGRALPAARMVSLTNCGHFASLEQPEQIANVIREEVAKIVEIRS